MLAGHIDVSDSYSSVGTFLFPSFSFSVLLHAVVPERKIDFNKVQSGTK